MKKYFAISLISTLFLFATASSSAQSAWADHSGTIRLNLEGGLLMPLVPTPTNLSVGFPYIALDNNGMKVQHEFTGSVGDAFSTVRNYVGLSAELGNGDHFFSVKMDISPTVHPEGLSILAAGYGYNWDISNDGLESASGSNTYFNISSSISLALINRLESVGSIDNNGQTITAFGKDIQPDYKAKVGGSSGAYHAYAFDVLYSHTNYGLMPQIAIVTNPDRTHLSLEFDISCFLPLAKSSGMELYWQSGATDFKKAAQSALAEYGVILKDNNTMYTKSPLNLASLQIGVKLGIQGRGGGRRS